jgi:signal transduction histidine kinase
MLGQVLSILLTNALNYTPDGGKVTIRVEMREEDGRSWGGFSVSDTGPGIPPEEQPRVFTRFFRGQSAHSTKVSGTGLGLAIAKEIVDRHRGQIEVDSTGIPGEGTTFRVWLPLGEGR